MATATTVNNRMAEIAFGHGLGEDARSHDFLMRAGFDLIQFGRCWVVRRNGRWESGV